MSADVEAAVLQVVLDHGGLHLSDIACRLGRRDTEVLSALFELAERGVIRAEQRSPALPRRWYVVENRTEEAGR